MLPDRITCSMSDRLYYADPSLASFEAHVSDIREVSRSQGRSLWQIALDRSAFYPTSGGQPHDDFASIDQRCLYRFCVAADVTPSL